MTNPISKLSLVINGVTTQLDIHDANALTTEIDSSGTGWVRFKCGLQICWGVSNLIQGGPNQTIRNTVSYNAFKSNPAFLVTRYSGAFGWAQLHFSVVDLTTTYASVDLYNDGSAGVSSQAQYSWQAIGYWK